MTSTSAAGGDQELSGLVPGHVVRLPAARGRHDHLHLAEHGRHHPAAATTPPAGRTGAVTSANGNLPQMGTCTAGPNQRWTLPA
ncbi:hypothetical protein ACWEOZ_01335 [Actinoplanes sp. NPDC004185]